jgi:hypothetical protein
MPVTVEEKHMQNLSMSWDRGEAALQSLGGMLGPVSLILEDGRSVSPLHVAPWENEDMADQPAILQRLRGEWPCVPFGAVPDRPLPERWREAQGHTVASDPAFDDPHGFGSNHHWTITAGGDGELLAEIEYPQVGAVKSLQRRIVAEAGKAELTFELTITARRDCEIPIGLHPCFVLPETPGAMRLHTGPHSGVWTHPLDERQPLSRFAEDQCFADLSALKSRERDEVDATALPFAGQSENLLLVTGLEGRLVLDNLEQNYRTVLEWDRDIFPSLMLWISNRGRSQRPWLNRHLALGAEPVRAAFDLGVGISAASNPLNQADVPTAWRFSAGESLTTRYSISASALP